MGKFELEAVKGSTNHQITYQIYDTEFNYRARYIIILIITWNFLQQWENP